MKITTPLVFAATILLAPFAHADDAQEHVAKGTRFYNIQDWPNALKEFKEAYTTDPKPETLWAIAQTQRLSGDCRSATLTYRAFMRTASAAGANAADEFIKKCDADLAAQQHALEDSHPKPVAQATQAAPSETHATAPVVVRDEPKKPGPWALDPLGDVLFIAAVGGLATGGVMLTLGNLDMSAASSRPTQGQYESATASARTEQTVGIIAASGGAVLAGLAIWRFAAVASRRTEQGKTAFVVAPTAGGVSVSYSARF